MRKTCKKNPKGSIAAVAEPADPDTCCHPDGTIMNIVIQRESLTSPQWWTSLSFDQHNVLFVATRCQGLKCSTDAFLVLHAPLSKFCDAGACGTGGKPMETVSAISREVDCMGSLIFKFGVFESGVPMGSSKFHGLLPFSHLRLLFWGIPLWTNPL